VRDVRVEALDAVRSSARRRIGLDALVPVATRRVARQRVLESSAGVRIAPELVVELGHRSAPLELADSFGKDRTSEPEQRRERGAVIEAGMVLDDHGDAQVAAARDLPRAPQRTSELLLYRDPILSGV
jgi:hypothetical protein